MIPDEAVELALIVNWDAEGDQKERMRAALEAAAPYMLGSTEFGVFRKGGDDQDAPMNNFTYPTRERAESAMQRYASWDEWLEVRERSVTEWAVVL